MASVSSSDSTAQPEQRRCKECGETKPLREFSWHRTRGRYLTCCKECERRKARERRSRRSEQEKERCRARHRQNCARYRADGRYAASQEAWRQDHREALNAYYRARYHADKDRVRGYIQAWLERNPFKRRAIVQREYAARNGLSGDVSADDLERLWHGQGGRCAYCAADLEPGWDVDHATPITRGGAHAIENIRLSCPPCNDRKGTMTEEEFLDDLGRSFS